MKRLVLICFLLINLFLSKSFSQTYGNEWINYSQTYYKFKLINEGIYKIDYQTLVDAGVANNGFDFNPAKMQLFGRDKQQPIYVVDTDGNPNVFGPGDYFMFYFERNNGWLDSTLYEDPTSIGNPYFCLFNDTINYFFSWSSSTNNLRYSLETSTASDLTNYPTVSPFCLVKQEIFGNGFYNEGRIEGGGFISTFSPGEGYSNPAADGGGASNGYSLSMTFNTPNKYSGSGAPQAVFHSKTNSNSDASSTQSGSNHHLNLTIGSSNNLITDSIFGGYKQIIINKNIPLNQISNGSNAFNFNIINDLGALTDYQTFSYASLIYPRLTNLNGANKDKFTFISNIFQTKTRLEITSTSITNPLMFVRGANPYFVSPINNGSGNWSAFIPSTGGNSEVVFQDASLLQTVNSLSPVNGTGSFTNFSNISFEAADIMVYHPSLDSASQLYAAYRSSPAGGSYNAILSNIEELYLQFGGGIEKHNAGLRRFCHFVYNHSTVKPLALTILGKGYIPEKAKTGYFYNLNLIPAFGHPGSDICHTSNLEGSNFTPLIPTGRISVTSNKMLSDYLEKLKEYEIQQTQTDVYDSENKDWQKQVLHFSGGANESQQNLFLNYMNGFKSIIEGAYFAGNVTTYRKISSDPLDPFLLGNLRDQLSNGVSLINFFGHASATGFDLSIDSPDNWENQKKYPIVVGNGCHSGAIYTTDDPSFGESLIRTPNEGAIAYIASTDNEYDISVQQYCNELYNQFSPKNYGKTIGEQIKNTIEALVPIAEQSYLLKGTLSATNLDGDPLLKLNWHSKPELEITEESLYFEPEDINLNVDSIKVNLVIKNLGAAVTDTFMVEVKRSFPNSTIDSIYLFEYPFLNYNDTLSFKIPTQANVATGINTISVYVDSPESASPIEEQYDEINNNRISKTLFLKLDAIIPIYPYEFAVIPNDTVTVKASTVNPIGELKTYHFELDTTDQFNSQIKRHFTFSALGGVKEVKHTQWLNEANDSFPLICEDSMVYFWRTAIDSSVLVWNESSFQYIQGKEGWGQDHFFQFKNNDFSNVKYDRANRSRVFEPVVKTLECNTYDHTNSFALTRYLIDGQQMEFGACGNAPALHLVVIDPTTLVPWHNINNSPGYPDDKPGHYLGNVNHQGGCRYFRQERYFVFRQDSLGLNTLKSAFDSIPDGYYFMLYAVKYPEFNNWDSFCPSLYTKLASFGATQIVPGLPDRCFIFFSQKGNNSTTQEVLAAADGDIVSLTTELNSGQYVGYETSKTIGPAKEWKTLYWKQHSIDIAQGDTTRLIIELLNSQGILSDQIDTVFSSNDSIINLQNLVDAQLHPYLRLKALYVDSANFTPAQNDRWHVLYSPVPEAAIDGTNNYTWIPDLDTLHEGEEFKFAVDIKNISNLHMDSLLVSYWIEDHNHVKHYIPYQRQDSLRVSQILRDTIIFKTTGFPGLNSLWVEANPYVNGNVVETDQLEQYHFNNLLQVPFFVIGDDVNPILDVTFDGRHILNGDIVNPKSEIYISLKDNNEFLIMNDISDTTLFGIFLTGPDGVQKRIPFIDGSGNEVLQWQAAESQYKKFKIIYPAYFENDGIYTLLVQGSDRNGNISGDSEYRISFEVVHESSITKLMNYPNPFSTSTRFVFTLTGSEVPDEFLIQIMTVSGKVVREITEDQLGQIYIGRNITEYAWDGTDEFGDPLANGVYLYRVLSQINGEEIKLRESDADKYFTKEFGKMYIIR